MNTAFQPQRDIVSGHVPNASVIFNADSSAGKAGVCGAAGIKRAIATPSRYFAAMKALNAFPLFDGLSEEELPGSVVLSRLMDRGASR